MAPGTHAASRNPWHRGWRRLTRIWRSDTAANVDDELQFHFEQKVAEFVAQGMNAEQARARAEEEFGDVQTVRESLTQIDRRVAHRKRRADWWESVAQDLKFVQRSLRRAPIFTATVVVTLALGLGVNASVFTLLDQLYMQPPAGVTNAANVHRIYQTAIERGEPHVRDAYSYREIRALHSIAVEGVSVAGYSQSKVRLGRLADGPEIAVAYVEGDYFRVAGTASALGRVLLPSEMRAEGLDALAVISHSLWERLYHGDTSVVGQPLDIGSHRFLIVGVAAENFRGVDMSVTDIWLPLNTIGVWRTRKPDWYEDGNFNGIKAVFRTANSASANQFNSRATVELRKKDIRLLHDSMSTTALGSINIARGNTHYTKELTISTRLAGVSLVILLIACANVINLMLARSVAREREIAVRLALGVSRGRLLTQLLLESATLAILAGAVSMLVALIGTRTLRTLLWPDIQWGAGVIDQRAVLFTVTLSLLAGFATGLAPALQASRPSLIKGLKSSVRDGGNGRSRLRSFLLIAQAALSVVLIVGAGVFVNSLRGIESVDFGYSARQMFFVTVSADRELADRRREIERRLPEIAEQLRKMPGVQAVAVSQGTPMYSIAWSGLHLPGRDSLPHGRGSRDRFFDAVTPAYFSTVGMRVEKGRAFADDDVKGSEPVVIVDRYMAEDFWPGEDPLAKCVIVGAPETPCRRVVGVVAPSHHTTIIENPSQHYYVPLAQAEGLGEASTIVVRTATADELARLRIAVVPVVSALLGDWARPRTKSMDEIMADDMRPWQVGARLFTIAGILALIVAAVGIYSSLAYTISQRTQEMGVRVALGASAANIMRLVVGRGVAVVAIGVMFGIVATLVLGKVIASMLYETSPHDPGMLVASTLVLLAVAAVASSIPAWRASRVDPLTAMRAE